MSGAPRVQSQDATKQLQESIKEALYLLLVPGGVAELRILNTRKATVSGYYDDLQKMAQDAASMSGRAGGVYVTLNPVNPDLKARAYNRLREYAKHTTSDNDILHRRWLPVDFDPERPTGISSTDGEHDAAIVRAGQCKDWLTALGFPNPVRADSGNGAHLLYRIDLANDAESRTLIEQVLKVLDFRFTDDLVKVDTTTSNAARIWKVYGTLACKGDNLPERPHRQARVLEAPDSPQIVPVDLLRKLADMAPQQPDARSLNGQQGRGRSNGGEFDLDAWIAHHGLPIASSGPWHDGRKWIMNPCPWSPAHTNNAAYIVQLASGAIGAGCHHNGCSGNGWAELRSLYEGPDQVARTLSQTSTHPSNNHTGQAASDGPGPDSPTAQPAQDATPQADNWPEKPGDAAYYGLAGEFVRAVEPHSEADPVAVLAHFLAAFGCAVGKGPHYMVGSTKHEPRIYVGIVGDSSKARKTESATPTQTTYRLVDPDWVSNCIVSGLSSGEGLIHAVRDATRKQERRKENGKLVEPPEYELVEVDAGVQDKRLLVIEPELAGVLKQISRQGNILSVVIRDAWDRDTLQTLTKASPEKATGAHISIIGAITIPELRRELTDTEMANGFANRFIWLAVKRSKEIPRPKAFEGDKVQKLAKKLTQALEAARKIDRMDFSDDAGELWDSMYHDLSAALDGLVGYILARSETQVLRLALLYALLDGSRLIKIPHLKAAVELWAYSERSAHYVFGDASGDPIADAIYRALKQNGPMNRTQISKLFSGHESAARIGQALASLLEMGKACTYQVESDGGRSIEMWEAI